MVINNVIEAVSLLQQLSLGLEIDYSIKKIYKNENNEKDIGEIYKFNEKVREESKAILVKHENSFDVLKKFSNIKNLSFSYLLGLLIIEEEDGVLKNIDEIKDKFLRFSFIEEDLDSDTKTFEDIFPQVDKVFENNDDKILYLKFILDFKNSYYSMKKMILDIAKVIENNIKIVKPIINKYEEIYTKEKIKEITNKLIGNFQYEHENIVFSCIDYKSISYLNNDDKNGILVFGILINYSLEQYDLKRTDEWRLEKLKAIADPIRLKILKKAIEMPIYQQGLAKELEVSAASLSHHINILLSADFLKVHEMLNEANKVYYVFNREFKEIFLKEIERLFEL